MQLNNELTRKKAELLKLLSNPIRLCIAHQLTKIPSCNVSNFVSCMNASQPNISQNLAKLKASGILGTHKKGNEVYYYLASEEAKALVLHLFKEGRT